MAANSNASGTGSALGRMFRRYSQAPAIYPAAAVAQPSTTVDEANAASQNAQPIQEDSSTEVAPAATAGSASSAGTRPLNGMHRIRLVPHLEATRSLHFEPIERDLKEGDGGVKVGRFTDRQPSHRDPVAATLAGVVNDATSSGELGSAAAPVQSSRGQPGARGGAIPISGSHGGGGRIDSSRIAFKSKVVSRGHAEIWCEPNGKFFIRDTKSSSGTFLNHIRLSGPNLESKPFAIKDGDVVQLGVDYQGGTEEIYRCVKMRVELNRGWQREANQFNVNALRQLRALQGSSLSPPTVDDKGKGATAALPTNRQGVSVTDCCICLFSVTVCQALFIAPCSHVFHYKCIRPLLNLHHPGFSCPLCRTFADLDADVEEDEAWQESLLLEAEAAEARLAQGKLPLEVGTPAVELDSPMAAALPPSLTSVLLNGASSGDASGPNSASANTNGVAPRPPLNLATSPLLTDLQSDHAGTNAALGRGTAASSRRKNDWARPDTAVGSSAGPLAGDETFAVGDGGAETAGLTSDLGAMAVSDRVLGVDAAASLHRAGRFSTDAGSPTRRGSGPIAIGGSERSLLGNKATLTSSSLAGPVAIGSPEEGWPGGAVGGFSPGLEEAGTPLNSTFLSTLAEAPHATATHTSSPSSTRDFPQGRSAPALTSVPATIPAGASRARRSEIGANDMDRKRSSDGAEDVDTAEEDVEVSVVGAQSGHASAGGDGKGKARLNVQPDVTVVGDGSGKLPSVVPAPPIADVGPTGLNPSAQDKDSEGKHDSTSGDHGRNADNPSPPTSPTSESKMARFKRRISEAM
uniref:Component of the spindle assembly checkpoint dma1 n=1 Tax=Kalmanozyma brasiliensis (strain GHG001) TaxID=1365824 RepID=V5E409_KALBG